MGHCIYGKQIQILCVPTSPHKTPMSGEQRQDHFRFLWMGIQYLHEGVMIPSSVRFASKVRHVTHCMLLTVSLVWDVRSFKRPVAERPGVPTLYPSTNAIFSPDNKHIVTGSGGSENGGHGALLFLSRQNLDIVKELDVGATPVVVQWHPKINQVRYGPVAVTRSNKQHRLSWVSQVEH
jgi:hypothetical protein